MSASAAGSRRRAGVRTLRPSSRATVSTGVGVSIWRRPTGRVAARPDVHAVVHTHSAAAVAFAALDVPLLALSHDGVEFAEPDLPRFTRTGSLIRSTDLGRDLAGTIGDGVGCLVPQHGLVTVGPDAATAVMRAVLLDRACAVQLTAMAAGAVQRWSDSAELGLKRSQAGRRRSCTPATSTCAAVPGRTRTAVDHRRRRDVGGSQEDHVMGKRYQVVIVGGGSRRRRARGRLGRRGISCAVIERRTSSRASQGAEADAADAGALLFLGVARSCAPPGSCPPGYAIGRLTSTEPDGRVLARPAGRELVQEYYFQANERLPQYCTEEVLRTHGGAAGRREPLRLARDGRRAGRARRPRRHRARTAPAGCSKATTSSAATAAHSMVREQAGIERSGADFDQSWSLVVFRSRELHEA